MTPIQIHDRIRLVLLGYSSGSVVDDIAIIGLIDLLFDEIILEQHTTFPNDMPAYEQWWYEMAWYFVALADILPTTNTNEKTETRS